MADVTQQEAEELADALINAAGALVMNASQMNQSRCADARHRVVEALTRPAPSPSDVEAQMADVTLKPCPFCGSPGELEHGNDHHGNWFNLGCSDHWGKRTDGLGCKAGRLWYTETDTPEADAIAAWNTRPAPSPSDVETEALLLDYDKALIVAARNLDPAALSKPTFAELRSAVLARMRGAAVPEGWKLVPVEPTDSQIDAGQEFLLPGVGARPGPVSVPVTTASFIGLYAAMLAAAPEVPK